MYSGFLNLWEKNLIFVRAKTFQTVCLKLSASNPCLDTLLSSCFPKILILIKALRNANRNCFVTRTSENWVNGWACSPHDLYTGAHFQCYAHHEKDCCMHLLLTMKLGGLG